MTQTQFPKLTEAQIKHFIRHGHLVLHDCFSRELAEIWTQNAFVRLGYDPNDVSTWKEPLIHMSTSQSGLMSEIAPKA